MSTDTTSTVDETTPPATPAAAAVVPQMALGELLDTGIRKAVLAQVAAESKKIADGVVADMLTPEVIAGMRETAILEADRALNAVPVQEQPPAPKQDDAEKEEKEEEEEPPKPVYATLEAFVEEHLAHLYRREVAVAGIEGKIRWCPQWWDHSEVEVRLSALWRAFEKLRLGEGTEMAQWWLTYADPTMDRLFDPEGPFKHCSVRGGHNATGQLGKLPTVPAPEGWFEAGHAREPQPASVRSSLTLPTPAYARRQAVMDFPE